MLFSINDLTGFTANAEDFTASVIDVFLARDTMRISHLAIDIGGWLSNHTVVISADKLSSIDPDDRSITLQITKEQAQGATVLNTTTLDDGLQLSDIPELVLGPSREDVTKAFLAKNAAKGQFLPATAVSGSLVSNGDEDLGQVIGLFADTENLTTSHLAVDTGVGLPETQRVIPISLVESVGDADTKTMLKIDSEKLKNSPQLEEFSAIDRHWLDKVATYYGLT